MAPALARRGHEVWVVTRGTPGVVEDDGVRILRLEHPRLPDPTAERVLTARRVAGAVEDLLPDVVQAAEWEAEAWWLTRRGGAAVVTRLDTPTFVVDWLHLGRAGPDSDVVRRMERDQAARSDALIAPSRAIACLVAPSWGMAVDCVEVIPNPIEPRDIDAARIAEPPGVLPPRFIAYTGRIERRKGIEVLVDSLPRVLSAHPHLHMVFVGVDDEGLLVRALEPRRALHPFAERIHALGPRPREEALSIVARAEAVVLPSLWEAFGFVAAEALALGRPVVTTSGSGLAEVVEEGVSGWLVPPGDATALAEVLVERLGDPEPLRRVGEEGRRRARRFDADALARRLEATYQRVLLERPRRRAVRRRHLRLPL